ncbi:MAG: AMP-binding protein [Azospirillaceae bacterium]
MTAHDSSSNCLDTIEATDSSPRFVASRLAPRALWPRLTEGDQPLPDESAPLNIGAVLTDAIANPEWADRPAAGHPGGPTWRFGDLLDAVGKIETILRRDCRQGDRLLVRLESGPGLMAALIAGWRAGLVLVPTVAALRARELEGVLAIARPTHALTTATLEPALAEASAATGLRPDRVAIEDLALGPAPSSPPRPPAGTGAAPPLPGAAVATRAGDPCLILFTSGTTGRPKAAVHDHRAVLTTGLGGPDGEAKPGPGDVVTGTPSIAFAYGLATLFLFPLLGGARTVFPTAPGVEALARTIAAARPSHCATSPTAYRALAAGRSRDDLASIRIALSGGEALTPATRRLWTAVSDSRMIDILGATELLGMALAGEGPDGGLRPLPGWRARVVDGDGGDAPAGKPGRLALQGPTGCRYLDNAEAQTAYVRDGWNLTGDMVLRDADGGIRHLARADDLIVASGHTVAGPEIEAVIAEHAAVDDCAVVGLDDGAGGRLIAAAVVVAADRAAGPLLVEDLRAFVRARLAPFKVPRAVVFTDALPRTGTGKIARDRVRALVNRATTVPRRHAGRRAPAD